MLFSQYFLEFTSGLIFPSGNFDIVPYSFPNLTTTTADNITTIIIVFYRYLTEAGKYSSEGWVEAWCIDGGA